VFAPTLLKSRFRSRLASVDSSRRQLDDCACATETSISATAAASPSMTSNRSAEVNRVMGSVGGSIAVGLVT
jgi:hypothetical protein